MQFYIIKIVKLKRSVFFLIGWEKLAAIIESKFKIGFRIANLNIFKLLLIIYQYQW